MAALQLEYTQDKFNKLTNKGITPSEFLQGVMKYKANAPLVIAQLVNYHKHNGAAPQIEDFEIVDASLDEGSLAGKVKIKYVVQRFYGCSDMNTAENDHETWSYHIDKDRKCLVVNAPNFERLSTSDEF